jgi:hypothetical protein
MATETGEGPCGVHLRLIYHRGNGVSLFPPLTKATRLSGPFLSLSLSLKFLRPNLQCDWSPVTDRTNIRPTVISFFLSFFGWWLMVALSFIFSYNTGIKVNCTEE